MKTRPTAELHTEVTPAVSTVGTGLLSEPRPVVLRARHGNQPVGGDPELPIPVELVLGDVR